MWLLWGRTDRHTGGGVHRVSSRPEQRPAMTKMMKTKDNQASQCKKVLRSQVLPRSDDNAIAGEVQAVVTCDPEISRNGSSRDSQARNRSRRSCAATQSADKPNVELVFDAALRSRPCRGCSGSSHSLALALGASRHAGFAGRVANDPVAKREPTRRKEVVKTCGGCAPAGNSRTGTKAVPASLPLRPLELRGAR